MGMLGKLVTGTLLSKAWKRHEENQRTGMAQGTDGQYIPATDADTARGSLQGRGNAVMGRATQFYRENPTLVHALAATAGAILLSRMRRR
jgi:hypothetical protein